MYIATRAVETGARRDARGDRTALANMYKFAINNQHIFVVTSHNVSHWRIIVMFPSTSKYFNLYCFETCV